MAGIEPATATLAGRARYLSCHPPPTGFSIICLGLPFSWCSRYGRVNCPACTKGFSGRSIRPEVNETALEELSLGWLRVTACSRLPGNHSVGQGSRKPRRRIHVSGPLRRLARGHVSMVSRRQKPAIVFSGTFRDTVSGPGDGGQIPVRGSGRSAALIAGGLSVRQGCWNAMPLA